MIVFKRYLMDKPYRTDVHNYIIREKQKELNRWKTKNRKKLFCNHCRGIGYVTANDTPIDMKFLYNSNIVNKSIMDTLDATLSDMNVPVTELKKYIDELGFLYSDLNYQNEASSTRMVKIAKDLRVLAAGKGFQVCPVCEGTGFYRVTWTPPITKAILDSVVNFLQMGYCKIGEKRLIESLNVVPYITKTKEKPYRNPTVDYVRIADKYASQCNISGKEKLPDNLVEAFAEYVLKVLDDTIRVYTGLSQQMLRYTLHKSVAASPWIEFKAATIADEYAEMGLTDISSEDENIQYISFYVNEWQPKKGIDNLYDYIKDKVFPDFIQGLSKEDADILMPFSLDLLKHIILFTGKEV